MVNHRYSTCHLYFLDIHTRLKAHVYPEKVQVTRRIFHSIPLFSMYKLHVDIGQSFLIKYAYFDYRIVKPGQSKKKIQDKTRMQTWH